MSVKRIYSIADTTIWERSITANTGSAPILQLQAIYNPNRLKKEWSRILTKFNLSGLTADINAGNLVDPRTDSSVSAYMYLFNAPHGDEQARSFTVEAYPLTKEWDEGVGLDLETLSETGYANAVSAQSTIAWTTSGGDFVVDSQSASQAFDNGQENLKLDLTNLFKEWLNGATGNYGVILKLTALNEQKTGSLSANSTMYKKFFGRETNTRSRPYLQLEWPGEIRDDRNSIAFNSTGNLFFYNMINGQLQDLNGTSAFPGNITISGLTFNLNEPTNRNSKKVLSLNMLHLV